MKDGELKAKILSVVTWGNLLNQKSMNCEGEEVHESGITVTDHTPVLD